MSTFVKLVNLNEESFKKFIELFPTTEKNSSVEVEEHLSKLYDINFGEDGISIDWMNKNVGGKQFYITFHDGYYNRGIFQSEVEFYLENAWDLPESYLKKLINYFTEIDSAIVLYGTYVDEFHDPIGAFVYANNNYEDIEELYPGLDIDQIENDEYRDKAYVRLREHSNCLYEGYLDRLNEEEEDYASNVFTSGFRIELYFWDDMIVTENQDKSFDPYVTYIIQNSIDKVLKKHNNLGMTKDTFPIYFENSTLKLRMSFFEKFEDRKAIQAFLTLGTKLSTDGTVNWNPIKDWGLPDNENAWEFAQITELAKDFYLLINEINDGYCEKLAQIRWQVYNSITDNKDDYKINIYINPTTKDIRVDVTIGI